MKEPSVDMAIVGAGAAGLTAAIWASQTAQSAGRTPSIVLFDTRQKIGAKILMSGGTRCNVTNRIVRSSDFQGAPAHFVKHVFEAFTPLETIRFFKEIGVELVLEPTGKYFPITHSAQTVLDALTKEIKRLGVALKTNTRITEIKKTGELFRLNGANGIFRGSARKVILTTGGLSYPATGSDGTGYQIAGRFGHSMISTFPALTPLLTDNTDWKDLSGVSLDVRLSFFRAGRKRCEYRGPFLFTHFGFSGPAALDISRHFASAKKTENPRVIARFLPQEDEASVKHVFQSAQKKHPAKSVKNVLTGKWKLPDRFIETIFKKINMDGNEAIGKCSSVHRAHLARLLLSYPLEVTGVFGYRKAEITAGGVDTREISVSTMESKLVSGLHFAGEIMNVDGRIGGFNFQWAWSTGAVAGLNAARNLLM